LEKWKVMKLFMWDLKWKSINWNEMMFIKVLKVADLKLLLKLYWKGKWKWFPGIILYDAKEIVIMKVIKSDPLKIFTKLFVCLLKNF
jgi:hypothetical protein